MILCWETEAVCTLCDLQIASSHRLHLQCSLPYLAPPPAYPVYSLPRPDQRSVLQGSGWHSCDISQETGFWDSGLWSYSCDIYHGSLINSNFSNCNFGPVFVEMTFGWGQSSFRRQVQPLSERSSPRHQPFALQNVRPQFEGVTWLSDNKYLSCKINGLHFLFPHFMHAAWLTGSFNSKKRSWKHLLKATQSSAGLLQETFQNLLLLHLSLQRAGL